jgi:hypothetical protein
MEMGRRRGHEDSTFHLFAGINTFNYVLKGRLANTYE